MIMLKYYPNVVLFDENTRPGVGIITGWKTPRLIQDELSSEARDKVSSIGPLYTKNGINYIIANLFLNPQISHLILLEDSDIHPGISDSVREFLYFLKTKEINFSRKFRFTAIDIDEFCEYFRNHITVVSSDKLNEAIERLDLTSYWRKDIKDFPTEVIEARANLVSEKIGFMVRASTVKEAWERSLKLIGTYGNQKLSDYDERQLELMNLSIIVRDEDLEHPSMVGELGITKDELDLYAASLLSKEKPNDLQYTYGERLRNYENIDQLQYLIDTLQKKMYSRRAVAVLWNPTIETLVDEVPCIDLYQAIVQDNKLYMIAYLRANDVYNGFPRNIYGVLKIQDVLCHALGVEKGYINTIAGSAHVYERNFSDIVPYVDGHISFCEEDERGYFFIENQDNKIHVSFFSKDGVLAREYKGLTATSLRDKCCFHISNLDHAFYLGQELTKAEIALENGLPYVQDQKLLIKRGRVKNVEGK